MKIAVLNGSPKGMTSVTMQYVLFLKKKFPQHEFVFVHVTQEIKKLEEDEAAFRAAVATVEAADAVLWALPVYVLLVPGPYKRFIELLFERSAQAAFRDKYAAVLTTSVRFFDHSAHDYVQAISEDLGMHLAGSYSAEMYDLLKQPERKRLGLFAEEFFRMVDERAPTARKHRPLELSNFEYAPGDAEASVSAGGRKVLMLTDAQEQHVNLRRMVARFRGLFAEPVELVNLREISIRGGCMGCIRCAMDNVCVYRDADDVYRTYQKLMAADIVVNAAAITDRFLSSRWKLFWDRGFFNNHVPMLVGKQIGFILSGPLGQLPNLRQVLEASAELQPANLAGIVTDECGDSRQLDRLLDELARRLVRCAQTGYIHPPTFFGKAGKKILRDEIWGGLRFVFQADHRYYKKHGLYDFPKRSLRTRLTDATFALLCRLPSFRQDFLKRIRTEMIKPLEKVVEEE